MKKKFIFIFYPGTGYSIIPIQCHKFKKKFIFIFLGLSSDERKKTSCPGSPHSHCGSMCDHDDGNTGNQSRKCRRCRRSGRYGNHGNHSDRIASADRQTNGQCHNEHMNVHFSDQVSLQSFQVCCEIFLKDFVWHYTCVHFTYQVFLVQDDTMEKV